MGREVSPRAYGEPRRISSQADISDGVGRSVIAGEIHDCNDDLVTNAVVISDMSDSDAISRFTGANYLASRTPVATPTRAHETLAAAILRDECERLLAGG